MEAKDFVFVGDDDKKIENTKDFGKEFEEGDTVIVNGEEFTITKFINSKIIYDKLGFPSIYSWYKATKDDEQTNLFFFDSDIDSVEDNDKVAEKWWGEAYFSRES